MSSFLSIMVSSEETTLSLMVLLMAVVRRDCSPLEIEWLFGLGNGHVKHHGQSHAVMEFSNFSVKAADCRLVQAVCQSCLQLAQSIFHDDMLDDLHGQDCLFCLLEVAGLLICVGLCSEDRCLPPGPVFLGL